MPYCCSTAGGSARRATDQRRNMCIFAWLLGTTTAVSLNSCVALLLLCAVAWVLCFPSYCQRCINWRCCNGQHTYIEVVVPAAQQRSSPAVQQQSSSSGSVSSTRPHRTADFTAVRSAAGFGVFCALRCGGIHLDPGTTPTTTLRQSPGG